MNILYLIIILIVCVLFLVNKKDGFIQNEIHLYVISLKEPSRLKNIEKQQAKIEKDIVIYEGVNGYELDFSNLDIPNAVVDKNFYNNTKLRKGQMGCYLSHFNLYNKIKQDNLYGYTIIFEDDFEIIIDDFLNKVNESINIMNSNQIDFDILFLGYSNVTFNGELITNNIYKTGNGEYLFGTYGYVVNYKNIDKIIDATKNITTTIDDKLQESAHSKMLNVYAIYPYYVGHGNEPPNIINEPFNC